MKKAGLLYCRYSVFRWKKGITIKMLPTEHVKHIVKSLCWDKEMFWYLATILTYIYSSVEAKLSWTLCFERPFVFLFFCFSYVFIQFYKYLFTSSLHLLDLLSFDHPSVLLFCSLSTRVRQI